MNPSTTPVRLDLKKDERLVIEWRDGRRSTYPIAYLRSMCPCAVCKGVREGYGGHPPAIASKPAPAQAPVSASEGTRRMSLSILPGNYAKPLAAVSAQLVGNYALQIEWSDDHGSGIYSFEYLRQISPP